MWVNVSLPSGQGFCARITVSLALRDQSTMAQVSPPVQAFWKFASMGESPKRVPTVALLQDRNMLVKDDQLYPVMAAKRAVGPVRALDESVVTPTKEAATEIPVVT